MSNPVIIKTTDVLPLLRYKGGICVGNGKRVTCAKQKAWVMFFFKLLIQLAFVSGAFAGTWSCSNNVRTSQLSAIAASNGTITSPNYPSSYSRNLNCQWQITVPTGKWVKLTFVRMDLEYRSSCLNDYVELRNGFNPQNSRMIGRYCGTSIPSPKYSSSNIMLVKFKSDYSRSGMGFKANWRAVDHPGENTHNTHHGRSSSSSRSSSGGIGGSVAGLIVLIIFVLVVYYYCKYRRNRATVIVRETRAAAQPTVIVANTNVVQQQQAPMANMAPQHPQAMTNPAYSPPPTGPYGGQYPQQPPFQGVPYAQPAQPAQQGYFQPPAAPYPPQATQPPVAPYPPQATQPPPYTEVPTKQ